MKVNIFVTIAVMIIATSCGQSSGSQKSKNNEMNSVFDLESSNENFSTSQQEVFDKQFAALMKEIYFKLPESVMCDDLKTDKQRKSVNINSWDNPKSNNDINHISYDQFYGEGTSVQWDMAGYLTDNRQDVVIIVRLWSSVNDEYETKFDKTLNYNIKSGKITEITRPLDPFTVDELINESHFETTELAGMANAFFNLHNHPVIYVSFDRNGFVARANLLGYAPFNDPWDEQNRVRVIREWNGQKFAKSDKLYVQKLTEDDYIPGEIGYQGDIVEAYRYYDKTGENIVILAESDIFETAENEYGDVEYYKNIFAYRFLNINNDWEEKWRLYDYSDECFIKPTMEFLKGSFSITDLNNDGVAETWIMYIKACRGDVSPDPMFLIMNDNVKFTYTISGLTKILMSDGVDSFVMEGGEYELDERFKNKNTPAAFVTFAKNLWEKHIEGK